MDLPYEVLVYLFNYLPRSDRKAASETCRSWYVAANDSHFLKNKMVVMYKSNLSDHPLSPLPTFINSPTAYCNYLLYDVEITPKSNEFWERNGENILNLTIRDSDICEKMFIYILQKCPNLEALNIENCKEIFMSGRLLEDRTDGLSVVNLENMRILSLFGNQYLTDSLFNRFVKSGPFLEQLNLSGCSLQFHPGLVNKFYPSHIDIYTNPSECVFTFYFVLKCIESKACTMKRLIFSKTLIDGRALKALSQIEDLHLESLEMHCCNQLTSEGICALAYFQPSLRELNIGMCSRVTDESVVTICKKMINLEYLNIQGCKEVSDLGIRHLKKLTKLKRLNISQCKLITKDGIEEGVCYKDNKTLKELDLHCLSLDENTIAMIGETLPNLELLDLGYCFNGVTDKSVQVLFKNLVYLHTLKLNHCDKVSDAGLTGMGKLETESDNEFPIMDPYLDDTVNQKIHLGSRAEEEIVRDAVRKREVMKMCEKLTTDTYTGYSLASLKRLRELDISGCNRITDVSLTYAFNFKELSTLNMSSCQQITKQGIEHLVKNCPSIEQFNLNDCYNLKDNAVAVIVKGLHRLKKLELRGCNQLSDETLEAIHAHCTKLKFLDVQGCRKMTQEMESSVASLATMHTVLMSRTPCVTEGLEDRAPASPPFLPWLVRGLLSRSPNVI